MVSHKKATEILKNWGMEKETVSDIYYEGTGNRNESAYYVGNEYVLKFSANLGKLKSHITISKALEKVGLSAATPVATGDGEAYVADGELYFCLTKRLAGQQMKPKEMYEEASTDKARFVGEVIGQLSLALANVEALVEEVNIYERVTGWAIPQLAGKLTGAEKVFAEYENVFGRIYDALPKQVIHRDPNPGNIILSEDKWGFIDFDLAERNVRIYYPCYAATAVLSESFGQNNEKWLEVYRNIIYGYDSVVQLTAEEYKAIPYVMLANQFVCVAWFATYEKYHELFGRNVEMTHWLIDRMEELKEI